MEGQRKRPRDTVRGRQIDVFSKQILSIIRNYDKPKKGERETLPEARIPFAKYTYVPGFGFYDIGLLHILSGTLQTLLPLFGVNCLTLACMRVFREL